MEPFRRPIQKPNQEKSCKMVTKRTGNTITRSFEGECSREQIRALANIDEESNEEQENQPKRRF